MKFFKHTLIFSFTFIISSCIWLSPQEPTLLLSNEESEEEIGSKDGFVHDVIESKALKPIFQVESLPEGWIDLLQADRVHGSFRQDGPVHGPPLTARLPA